MNHVLLDLDHTIAPYVESAIGNATDAEARRRLFLSVRDMPYCTDGASDAIGLVRLRRGNCLAKADLLQQGFGLLGYEARWVKCRYELPPYPPEVDLIPNKHDIHTALEVLIDDRLVLVDGTLDPPLAQGGLVVSEWDGFVPTQPNFEPVGPFWREGIDDTVIAASIAEIAELWREQSDRARRYNLAFNAWLDDLRGKFRS